jgi:ATP-binding cassette subfamily C (CFTR/MRP) protein 1
MATGSAKFLSRADHIVVLSADGTVEGQGSFQELNAAGKKAAKIINSIEVKSGDEVISESKTSKEPKAAAKTHTAEKKSESGDKKSDATRQNGDFGIYKYYFACISWTVVAIFLLLQFAYTFLCTFPSKCSRIFLLAIQWLTGSAIWLKWWADANMQKFHSPYGYYIGIYTALQLGALALSAAVTW